MQPAEAIEVLGTRLTSAGYKTGQATIAGCDALVARRSNFRLKWWATRLHSFVVPFVTPELDEQLAEELTAAAQQHAIEHKGGLPRGLQTGTATVVVFLSKAERPVVRSWFARQPEHRNAALRFPVLAELATGALTYFEGRMPLGWVYAEHLRGVVEGIVRPAIQPGGRWG
jgi:hypothetical protein